MKLFVSFICVILVTVSAFSQQLSFQENNGFSQDTWKYVLRGPKSSLYFYDNYFVIQTFQKKGDEIVYENVPIYFENSSSIVESYDSTQSASKTYRFTSSTKSSSSSHFESIVYRNISKNVDCRFFIFNNSVRFDFVIKNRSVNSISLTTSEGNSFTIEHSKVFLSTKNHSKHCLQDIALVYPLYQDIQTFTSQNRTKLTFALPYNSDFAIIDPTFSFASFLGGSSSEYIYDVKIMDNNKLYAVGYTTSIDFPTTPGVYKTTTTSADVFVYAVDLITNQLLFSTFLGGTNSEIGYGIDIASNVIIICGQTNSTNFPITAGSFSTTYNGGNQDGFVTGFSINGSTLLFSTFVGGTDSDVLYKLGVNNQGSIITAGMSRSSNFPLGSNPAQFIKGNGNDGVVVSLSPTASSLFGGTFLGGNNEDRISNLSISSTNEIVVVGTTASTNFPLQLPMYPTFNGGLTDAFVTRYNQNLSTVLFSTYFGGINDDVGNAVSFDTQNNIIFGGTTNSTNLPTLNEINKVNRGGNDVFLTKITPNRVLDFSTYLGGVNDDNLEDLAVNTFGNIYITGFTSSNNFPLTSDAPFPENKGSGDMYITKLYRTGQSVLYSTYYGDIFQDVSTCLSINTAGTVALGGYTQSSSLQTLNAIDSTFNGGFFDAYLMTFFLPDQLSTISTDSVQLSYCRGSLDSVSFSYIGGFERNNTFVVEISDSNGNFSPGRVIGNIQSPTAKNISFFIPFDVVPGSLYKIRVKSTSPSVIGTPTIHSIRINSSPTFSLGNDTTICVGNQIEIGSNVVDFTTVQWFSTDTTIFNIPLKKLLLTPKKTHKYWALVTDSNGCTSIDTILIRIQNPPKSIFPKTIQFCETDTISFLLPDSLIITEILPNSSSVIVKDSVVSFHSNLQQTVYISLLHKKNGCSRIDTIQLIPINLQQVIFSKDTLVFQEKQECEQYVKGQIQLSSLGNSPVIIDSLLIENSGFSFDSLTNNRKRTQFSIQANSSVTIPIYFIGNTNQNSIVRLFSSKCIVSDSIKLIGTVDKNTVEIPLEIIHNIDLECRNNTIKKREKIPIINNSNSRKIIKIDTNYISTISFESINIEVDMKDSNFIYYTFNNSILNQIDTINILITDSVCSKYHKVIIRQNINNISNEYQISSASIDTIICDSKSLEISLPISKKIRKATHTDTLKLINLPSGFLVSSAGNPFNTVNLLTSDSLSLILDIDQISKGKYTIQAVVLPCNDTLSFDINLSIEQYSSTIFNQVIVEETSTKDSILFTVSFLGDVKEELKTLKILLNGINNISYIYDSLQKVSFIIDKNLISQNDTLQFNWGKDCLFQYVLPVNKPKSSITYSLDTLSALPGDTVVFSLKSEVQAGIFPIQDTVFLSTSKYLLYPLDFNPIFVEDTVKISIPHIFTTTGLSSKSIRFLALLGDINSTNLKIHSNSTIPTLFTNGFYKMEPICLDRDIFVREVKQTISITLSLQTSKNTYIKSIFETDDDFQIELFTLLGQNIPISIQKLSKNEYSIIAKSADSYQYYLLLRNSKNTLFIPIIR